MITVIIPVYNREKVIQKSINSVLKQSFSDIEVLIIDDGSSDNTLRIISDIKDKRIRLISLKNNSGATVARNIGLKEAKGEYIAFQDSDDYWFPNKLEEQIKFLDSEDADLVACSMKTIDGEKMSMVENLSIHGSRVYKEDLFPQNFISTQTILAKKEVFRHYKFDENISRYQDWDLVIRISEKYKIFFDENIYVEQYIQTDSITKNMSKSFDSISKIVEKNQVFLDSQLDKKAGMFYWLGLSKRAMKEKSLYYFFESFKMKPKLNTFVRMIMASIKF